MRRFVAIIAFLATSLVASAQNSIRVETPNLVAADEQFNVTFVVEGEDAPTDFQWSAGDDFQLVWGPQRGTSTSVSIINGKRTRSSQSSYTYILLPKKTGAFPIPAATATVKGKRISSGSVTIEVVGSGTQPSAQAQQGSGQQNVQSSGTRGDVSSEDLFLRMIPGKSRAVVGEPVDVVLKLYQRTNIAGFEDARFPSFNGFWSQEVQAPTNIEFHRENVGNQIYNTAVLRSWVIIPQQSGELVIDPAELVCLVNVRIHNSSTGSIFDSFFQDDYHTIRKRIATGPYTIRVEPLPAGAPASFSGGVGKFTLQASLTRDSLTAHDASSLKVTVSGTGNVSLLEAPKLSFPPDFEVYDVKSTEKTDKSAGRTSGSKTFEYPFIPRSHGDFTVGPVEFTYYDVEARKYLTLKSEILQVSVARAQETVSFSDGGHVVQGVSHKDVRNLGSDIRYIRTGDPGLEKTGLFFVFSTSFWILLFVLAASGFSVWAVLRKRSAMKADVALTRNRTATKMARKRLANAGGFLDKNLRTAFYEELHKALLGYVGDKLNMDIADMTKENIASGLSFAGVPDSLSNEFDSLLEACEMARYSPDEENDSMKDHYEKAVNVISGIDASFRSRTSSSVKKALPVVLAFICLNLGATPWEDGIASYADGDFEGAVSAWSQIEADGQASVDLYYNLGNAWFKLENYAEAILYYERALRLDPSDRDVIHNLEFARSFTQDKIEEIPLIWIEQVGHKMCRIFTSDTWAVLFFVFFAVAAACTVIFFLSRSRLRRKSGFFAGIAALLLALLCLDFAQWQWSDYRKDTSAIVMKAVCPAKSSPSETSAKDLFVLHEGTKVKVIDDLGEWSNVELSDGRQGWIKTSDIQRI